MSFQLLKTIIEDAIHSELRLFRAEFFEHNAIPKKRINHFSFHSVLALFWNDTACILYFLLWNENAWVSGTDSGTFVIGLGLFA